jgi:hypothetical protein
VRGPHALVLARRKSFPFRLAYRRTLRRSTEFYAFVEVSRTSSLARTGDLVHHQPSLPPLLIGKRIKG